MRSRPALVAVLTGTAFMLVRWGLMRIVDADDSPLYVEILKTPPRLLAAAVCWWAMRPRGTRAWGWTAPVLAGAVLASLQAVAHASRFLDQSDAGIDATGLAIALATTVPVAVWEELCYRGLLYGGLRETRAPLPAALLSSAFFTVMHWGAIPTWGWPAIFMTGFVFCAALELGAGLPWLMFAHWALDSAYFLRAGPHEGTAWPRLSDAMMLALSVYAWRTLRASPGASPSPTLPG